MSDSVSPLAGESSQGCPDSHPHGDGVVPAGQRELPDGHDAQRDDVIQRGSGHLGVRLRPGGHNMMGTVIHLSRG